MTCDDLTMCCTSEGDKPAQHKTTRRFTEPLHLRPRRAQNHTLH
jgi:hypothetical protein